MKKFLATLALMFAACAAFASCPPYAPYNCHPGWGGKMVCGCGQ